MRSRSLGVLVATSVAAITACSSGPETSAASDPGLGVSRQALFDCNDSTQAFTCGEPANANKRFICHATGSNTNPYVKLSVARSSAHAPGVAHGDHGRADLAPGASGTDAGSGLGLDCECNVRVCQDVCTGAANGTSCDDADKCTGAGTCSGGVCQAGPPSCTAGAPIDACNEQSGACESSTGACLINPLPANTVCAEGKICDGAGSCVECIVPTTCPGADDSCQARTCTAGTCGVSYVATGTACGTGLVCNGSGTCVGVPHVVINEVESNGGVPGDWVELTNDGTAAADLSGWKFLDGDNTHVAYVFPAGTILPVGGFLSLNESSFNFGLGTPDTARLFDPSGTLIDSFAWTPHAVTTYGRCPDGSGAFRTTTTSTKGTANDCRVTVKINEIESNGGVPGDWVELFNPAAIPFNLSGWTFKDNDNTHVYTLPAGATIAAGGYYVIDEAVFGGFGLGAPDAVRIYDAQGELQDSFTWASHASTTYGRCPNGSGPFAVPGSVTKGAANTCNAQAWPGANAVTTADGTNVFGTNLSDLFYEAAAGTSPNVLWAVRNGPSTLFRLVFNGSIWTPDTTSSWGAGKTLRYPNGTGAPDSEGVTKAELSSSAIYVSTERNNDVSAVSRLSILRFDTAQAGSTLIPTHEWNLTASLPAVGSNLGLEGITWIPDSFLVASSFFDELAGHTYVPSEYPDHGTGLFFVGIESTGIAYGFALDHVGSTFKRLATFSSGATTQKALYFDRDLGYLWTQCGPNCSNTVSVLGIDTVAASPTFGRFTVRQRYAAPSTMPNILNEGIAFAPESQCSGGFKKFFWTDDSATSGHSIRVDSIPCGSFLP